MNRQVQECWDEYKRTGKFGAVHLGMGREQVRALLGEPEQTGGTSRKYRRPSAWKYGPVEFFFKQGGDELQLIYAEDGEGNCILSISCR